eukprot:1149709-Pelagomonas_calceolata.AAC.1
MSKLKKTKVDSRMFTESLEVQVIQHRCSWQKRCSTTKDSVSPVFIGYKGRVTRGKKGPQSRRLTASLFINT